MIVPRVRRTLRERALLDRGATVLVACSGGPDSAALLHVLVTLAPELGLTLACASVDHGLRADASDDVAVARSLADGLGVPFSELRVEVPGGPSVQAGARAARYEALAAEAERRGAAAVAVGHTLDDQAETVLARLLRGAGIRGLAGIAPRREPDGVVRPLLDCRRESVRRYVAEHRLPHRHDPSNDDPSFERARLRAGVLPRLLDEDPRALEHLADLADEARAYAGWLSEEAPRLLPPEAEALDPVRLAAAPAPLRRAALAGWIEARTRRPARRAHLEALERALADGRGEVLLGGGWVVRREAGWIARREPDHPTRSHREGGSERSASSARD